MVRIFPIVVKKGGAAANVQLGPDFGEKPGSDGTTHTVGVQLTMPAVSFGAQKTVGVNLSMPTVILDAQPKTVGVHLSATVLAAPFWMTESHSVALATATTIDVAKPAGTVVGDLLVAIVMCYNAAAAIVPSLLSGWTNVLTDVAAASLGVCIMWRVVDGSEPATFSFAYPSAPLNGVAEVHRVTAFNAGTVVDVANSTTLGIGTTDTNPDSPAVATTVANCLVFYFLAHFHAALSQTHTPPASFAERTDLQTADASTKLSSHTFTRVKTTAGSTGTQEHTCTEVAGTQAIMASVAIRPGVLVLAT